MSDVLELIVIPKATGTHADVLAAVGLADLLGPAVRLREETGGFAVMPPGPLSEAFFERLEVAPGYPFLQANENVSVPPGAQEPVDYKRQSALLKEYRSLQEQKRKNPQLAQDPAFVAREQELRPPANWRQLQVLNVLQGDETSNQVHAGIVAKPMEERRKWVTEGVKALATGGGAKVPWKAKLVQVFTPTAAKGYARLKPDSTNRGDPTKEQWVDPFIEWLKYRGYFRVACPYFVGSKGEHVRLLCPIPADISAQALADVATELRRAPVYGSPAKLDSLAVLRLAGLLIEHSVEYHQGDAPVFQDLLIHERRPADVISGVTITHYQSLGSAKVVSAMTTLALPAWFKVDSEVRARQWLETLEEHRRAVRALNDEHSDEMGLLIHYRRFLERRGDLAVWALLEFMGAYGQFLIRAREQKRRVPAFTTNNFRGIIMGLEPEYSKILDDPGFEAVAAAVRRATVSAQALKAMGKEHREIHYDLIPDLRRKRKLADSGPFLEVVADFVATYNAENARRREMGKRPAANVTTEEFAAFCRLVETNKANLVGALLCAYGTCRSPREQGPGEQEPEGFEENSSEVGDAEED